VYPLVSMLTPLKLHQLFVGPTVTEMQTSLYQNPNAHGMSSKEKDSEKVDATVILALSRVIENGSCNRVHVIVQQDLRTLVFDRIHVMAKTFTESVKKLPDVKHRKKSSVIARKLLESLHLPETRVNHIFSIPEPERWVAIGYSTQDPLPEWLSKGLT
jgi:hypothetical protein